MTTTVLPDRLAIADQLPLTVSSHPAPSDLDKLPGAACAVEKWRWVVGLPWNDEADGFCCPVIAAFCRRYNDATDQDGRDRLDAWGLANLPQLLATAGDGHQHARGYIAADHAVRVSLPVWLDIAGASDAAEACRALPPIVDAASARAGRDAARAARPGLKDYWTWRSELREKVYAAVHKAIKEKKATDAAAAVSTAYAAAYAASYASYAAAAASTAASYAAAAAVDGEDYYGAVYSAVKERMDAFYTDAFQDAAPLKAAAIGMLDRMLKVDA